ncbi:hypothetical protein ABZT06_42865 [Streptomyces sp. NPDC005483]
MTVAAERVNSGAHYSCDVAVGGAVGLASVALVRGAQRLLCDVCCDER